MKNVLRMLAVAALAAAAVFAADLNGKWKASYTGQGGQTREQMFDFKVDGATLTGTVSSQQGESKINDGKVDGDNLEFTVTRNFNGNEVKQQYKGKVEGGEIKFSVGMGQRQIEMVAKRPS